MMNVKSKQGKVILFPISKRPTLENKTGSWRTFMPIVTEKCIGCKICIDVCPEGCITLDKNKKAKIDYNYCKGCLICVVECPRRAFVRERKVNTPSKDEDYVKSL